MRLPLRIVLWTPALLVLTAFTARAAEPAVALQRETIIPQRTAANDGRWFIDFGRDAYGQFEIDAPAAQAGRTITVRLGEALGADGRLNPKAGRSIRFLETTLALHPGANRPILREADARRMPSEIGAVMPFRYAEIEGWPADAGQPVVRQITVFAPFDLQAAHFECDRSELNEIWELCRYSMKATSFCGLFVDGDRERLPYEADAWINQLGWYATNTDVTVPRATLDFLLAHPTWPTEWQAHAIFVAWADYLQTGDDSRLRRNYERLRLLTLSDLARDDGLISTAPSATSKALLDKLGLKRIEDIVDWPKSERDDYDFRPVNTVVNAFHFAALERMALIATALRRPVDATNFRAQADKVHAAINAKLFDPASGRYVDGEGSPHSSIHANFFPLALGAVPDDRRAVVGHFLARQGMKCSVYGAQYLLEALYAAGESEAALQLMLNRTDRGWWHMIHDVGTTITLEAWDTKYKPNQDYNHAWGAAPANIIPRFIVGVQPIEPSWRVWRLAPHPASLTFYTCRTPTPHGAIETNFRRAAGRWTLDVTVPAGTSARIQLPPGEKLNLATIASNSAAPRRVAAGEALTLPPGKHRLAGN
jgi:hypothetical protein